MSEEAKACSGNGGERSCDPGSVYALGGEVKSGQRVCLGHIVKDCDSWLRVMDLFL